MQFSLNNFGPETRVAVTYEATDAEGELVTMTTEIRGRAVQQIERGLLSSRHARRDAWRKNSVCVTCGQRITRVDDCGVLGMDGGLRVAHKRACFVRALGTVFPDLTKHTARAKLAALLAIVGLASVLQACGVPTGPHEGRPKCVEVAHVEGATVWMSPIQGWPCYIPEATQ